MSGFDQDCRKKGWAGGALAGLVVALLGLTIGHIGLLASIFLGVITFLLVGAYLVWAFCDGSQIGLEPPKPSQPAAPVVSELPVAPVVAEPAPAPVAEPAPAAPVMAEPAVTEVVPVEEVAVKAVAEPEPEAVPAPSAEPEPEAEAKPKKPRGLKAPRKAGADDLKLIEGIGPKLEERLNEWGIFHFDQIAKWGAAEVAFADENVPRFKGRCSRDKWVAQAKIIVDEGLDAFLTRAKTNDY